MRARLTAVMGRIIYVLYSNGARRDELASLPYDHVSLNWKRLLRFSWMVVTFNLSVNLNLFYYFP